MAFDGILQHDDTAGFISAMCDNATIFIVDDDDAVRDSLKLLLESHGWRVEDYATTHDFIRAFRRRERQCLVLDHHLLDETGLDFLESEKGGRLQLPVIVVTGAGGAALKDRAAKAGALAYFDKPLDDSELIATIFKLIDEPA